MASTYQAWHLYQIASTNDEYSPEILENLSICEVRKQIPGPDQELVRVRAAALNYRDLLIAASAPK